MNATSAQLALVIDDIHHPLAADARPVLAEKSPDGLLQRGNLSIYW
ncbi:hypothetical protein P4S72_07690 [Vibrio sp. PP-XX7]